jgi:hypothetical protein
LTGSNKGQTNADRGVTAMEMTRLQIFGVHGQGCYHRASVRSEDWLTSGKQSGVWLRDRS